MAFYGWIWLTLLIPNDNHFMSAFTFRKQAICIYMHIYFGFFIPIPASVC